MSAANRVLKNISTSNLKLGFLNLEQVKRIDEVLSELSEYGEVHLIIQHGELRYINKVESYKAWKSGEEVSKSTQDGH